MGFSFNAGDTEIAGSNGSQYLTKPGNYHCFIESIEEHESYFLLMLTILSGDHQDQVNRKTSQRLRFPVSVATRFWAEEICRLACATGFYSLPQWQLDKEAGADIEFSNLTDAAGSQIVATFEQNENEETGKKYINIRWIKAVGDDRSQEVPLSLDDLQIFQGLLPRSDGMLLRLSDGAIVDKKDPTAVAETSGATPAAASSTTAGAGSGAADWNNL